MSWNAMHIIIYIYGTINVLEFELPIPKIRWHVTTVKKKGAWQPGSFSAKPLVVSFMFHKINVLFKTGAQSVSQLYYSLFFQKNVDLHMDDND